MTRYEYPSLRQGLVGAWCPSLVGTGPLVRNLSQFTNNATIAIPVASEGVPFCAANENGMVVSAKSAVFSGRASMSLWVKNPTGNACIFRVSPNTFLNHYYLNGSSDCYFSALRSDRRFFSALSSINRNIWHNVCVVNDGTNWTVYQGGLQAFQASATSFSVSQSILVGSSQRDSDNLEVPFGGLVDDFRLYNRDLTLAEIRLLASRRGIGLQPLPDRAAGLPRKLSVNVGGDWRPADAYVHNGAAFRLSDAKINVGGVWQ
jgi:hypothetical protein